MKTNFQEIIIKSMCKFLKLATLCFSKNVNRKDIYFIWVRLKSGKQN